MAADFDKLDSLIGALREIRSVAKEAAPEVARALDRELRVNIAAGRGPDGKLWQRTADGRTPLQGAGKALSVKADGTRVVAQVSGVEARHHLGAVKGGIRRQILPDRKLSAPVVAAIKSVLVRRMAVRLLGAQS